MTKVNKFKEILKENIEFANNLGIYEPNKFLSSSLNQTKEVFSEKWKNAIDLNSLSKAYETQKSWFLDLYGFSSESELSKYLKDKKIIVDTGCGLGIKSEWLAKLAPNSIVLGLDISDSIYLAAEKYSGISNLFFIKCDISNTPFINNSIDFVICDQVIMHTEDPNFTFNHLSNITKFGGEFACYVYRKKALPRELLDEYFRSATHDISHDQMWEFSKQITELGKKLSELNINIDVPEIPLLGIKGGEYDLQRFIYWNFIKCFWNESWGFDLSKSVNYDWYAPSNAKRYTKDEFLYLSKKNDLSIIYFHEEEACYSARFKRAN